MEGKKLPSYCSQNLVYQALASACGGVLS